MEVTVENPKFVNIIPDSDERCPKTTPPFVVMSLSLKTVTNHQKKTNEVVVASALVYDTGWLLSTNN